jgi:hypothetical protein
VHTVIAGVPVLPALFILFAGDHAVPGGAIPVTSTILDRFMPPPGFVRIPCDSGSFADWLRHRPLRPDGAFVHLYNGEPKHDQRSHAAVLDLSVGNRDLQQCADAIIRLRAEHLFATGRQDEIAFHFTNGFLAEWRRWRRGERIEVNNSHCRWLRRAEPDASHAELMHYLDLVFVYAGTLSLSRELVLPSGDGSEPDPRPGDVFIQGGSPGHAVIIMDVARSSDGRLVFLLAQSFMPAQEMHLLRNPADPNGGPWFTAEGTDPLVTPHWSFDRSDRRRFARS